MIKLIRLFSLLALGLIACSGKNSDSASITGKFTNSAKEKIVLEELSATSVTKIDSASIDEKGEFKINNPARHQTFYRLTLNPTNYIILILDSAEAPVIEGDARNLAMSYSIKGSKNSELMKQLNGYLMKNFQRRDSLQRAFSNVMFNDPKKDSIQGAMEKQYNDIVAKQREYIIDFINKNPNSLAALAAVEQLDPSQDYAVFSKVSENLQKALPKSQHVMAFSSKVRDLGRLAIGSPAPEITLNTPEGKPMSLSSLKGKYVLLDFWASWCGPCRKENPNVVKLYNQYKDKGFEIFSVSLDKDKDQWIKAIQADKLTWTHVSDLMFWGSPVVKAYNVQGIPMTYLLDKEGKILAKELRGEQLAAKLKEIFKQ